MVLEVAPKAAAASIEFLAVRIETPNTRAAYFRASGGSSAGAKTKGLEARRDRAH